MAVYLLLGFIALQPLRSATLAEGSGLTVPVRNQVQADASAVAEDVDKKYGTICLLENDENPAGEFSQCTFVYTAGSEGVKIGESICLRWDYWRTASAFEPKPEVDIKTQNGAVLSGVAEPYKNATWPKPIYTPLAVLKVDACKILPGEKVRIAFSMRFPEVNNLEGGIYAFILTADGKEIRLKNRIRLSACSRAPGKLFCTAEARPVKGQKGRVTIAVTDKYDNPVTNFSGTVQISCSAETDLPMSYTFKESDRGFKHFEAIFQPDVVTRITASYKSIKSVSNPVLPREKTEPGIFFGDIHVHCEISTDAVGSPDHAYEHARNFCGLDFAALSDHSPREEKYKELIAAGNRHNVPLHFPTMIGFEWSSGRYGHRNVYYPDDKGPEQPKGGDNTAPWWKFLDEHHVRALTVPHHSNMRGGLKADGSYVWGPLDWSKSNDKYQRIVEIDQNRGSSEAPGGPNPELRIVFPEDVGSSVQTALSMGHRLGFIGSTDTHWGRPGIGEGMAVILSSELARESLFNSLYDRHCYAVSGARILVFFTVNGFPMGSEIKLSPKDQRTISFRAIGTGSIKKVELLRNNEVIKTWDGTGDDISGGLSVTDELGRGEWYYIRITQADAQMAWSSPVWVDIKK
ncbi:MAG: CehA/McbA family metallohydrolase [Kiritimatiellaceae bacterium]|nr:CehA/McbA family metallohydrolase [Kiritimatiellaceae bacterium]